MLLPLLFVATLALAVVGWLAGPPLWAAWRRSRITAAPFPSAWRAVLRRRMPLYQRLPVPLQRQLQRHVQVIVATVPFIGCRGQVITDEVRVLVAAQASLLLLGRPAGRFRGLRQVLVYPGAFVVERPVTDAGIVQDARRVLVGESWQQGQLILSWADVLAGAADPQDGHNVVIHEFAHQLDQENGPANGAPFLGRREGYPALGGHPGCGVRRIARAAGAWRAHRDRPLWRHRCRRVLRGGVRAVLSSSPPPWPSTIRRCMPNSACTTAASP